MKSFSRRHVLGLSAAGLSSAGLLLPRPVLSGSGSAQRKFLFLFCPGGWDQLLVFCPIFNGNTDRDSESDNAVAEVNGITFVDGAMRPNVRTFFETWGDRTCVINGFQVPSVAHDVCMRMTMTGNSRGTNDDWASIIGATATGDPPMPNFQISGPLYPNLYTGATVRAGLSGQLPDLLDGTALTYSDVPVGAPPDAVQALEEAFLRDRLATYGASAGRGWMSKIAEAEITSLSRATVLSRLASRLRVGADASLSERASVIADCLEQGLSRSGMIAYEGFEDLGWDTHINNGFQVFHFNELFSELALILDDLASRPGSVEASLLDETTVVVLSEMGRVPLENAAGGKEHWTWTSAMLMGAGVAGGQCIGSWTESIEGNPVDLASGESTESGTSLYAGHVGATILALADLDPGDYLDPNDGTTIEAALA